MPNALRTARSAHRQERCADQSCCALDERRNPIVAALAEQLDQPSALGQFRY
jgi:hypothetical protein